MSLSCFDIFRVNYLLVGILVTALVFTVLSAQNDVHLDDAVVLLAWQRTCDSQVAGSSLGWASLCSGLGQATYTCVPLSSSNILQYHPRG